MRTLDLDPARGTLRRRDRPRPPTGRHRSHPHRNTGAACSARGRQRYGMVTMCIGTGMGAAGLSSRFSIRRRGSVAEKTALTQRSWGGSAFGLIPAYFWRHIPAVAAGGIWLRLGLNWFPAWPLATGARLVDVSRDLKVIVVRLPLKRHTLQWRGDALAAACMPPPTRSPCCSPPTSGPTTSSGTSRRAFVIASPGKRWSPSLSSPTPTFAAIRADVFRDGACDRSFDGGVLRCCRYRACRNRQDRSLRTKQHYKSKVAGA